MSHTNTFDQGVSPGGMRTKGEIRALICYVFCSVNKPMSKDLVLNALQQHGLCNYFEASACFDDEIRFGNLQNSADDNILFEPTEACRNAVSQLESSLPQSAKEKAYRCALLLLHKERVEKENRVDIEKIETGFFVKCAISGGETDLLSFSLYVPNYDQALIIKKNFLEDPSVFYKTFIAIATRDSEFLKDALEIYSSDITD